eukprot:5612309-Pyramimonas_sp.AAC.1
MHGVLVALRMCESVSLYGFNAYPSRLNVDPYKGMDNAYWRASGWRRYDWEGERYVLRLLHAAGKINVCSV